MSRTTFSRREIFRRVGGAGLLLAPVLAARRVRAAPRRRLVTFFYGNGPTAYIDQMFPRRVGNAWDWNRGQDDLLTVALQPHAAYMSICRKLHILGGNRPKGAHGGAQIACFTATNELRHPGVDDHASSNVSIDHWYAQRTGTEKLYLAVGRSARRVMSSSYHGDDQPSVPEQNITRAYDTLFRNFRPTAGDGDAARLSAARKEFYVLNLIQEDLKSAQRIFGLSAEEKRRLETYAGIIDGIERRVRADAERPASSSKQPPTLTSTADTPGKVKANLDIIVGALALGLRQSAAFQLGEAYGNFNFSFFSGAPGDHHAAQHGGSNGERSARRATVWIHQQVAYLLQLMRASDEGDGSNLLDHSVVLVGCDCPHGGNDTDHNYNMDHPTFLFGKAGGRLRGNVDVNPAAVRDHTDILATAAEALVDDPAHNEFRTRRRFRGLIQEFLA